MNKRGTFLTTLYGGDIGEREAAVLWRGYRTKVPKEDDCNEMEITVFIDIDGKRTDITNLLNAEAKDRITAEAWAEIPTFDDIAADRAEHEYQTWRDEHKECCQS